MASMFRKGTSLPLSHNAAASNNTEGGAGAATVMRRRLSSMTSPPCTASASASAWALHRSKSMGESVRNWWDWGWGWILSRKPLFTLDLEMNHEETSLLGYGNKGSWRHVFYKLRSHIRKLLRSDHVGLPQTAPHYFRHSKRRF